MPRSAPLAVVLLFTTVLQAGCYSTTTVATGHVDRLVAAQTLKGEVALDTVEGDRDIVDAPVRTFTIVPTGRRVLLVAPGATRADAVAPSAVAERLAAGWTEVDREVRAPFRAAVEGDTLAVTELPLPPCTRRRLSDCWGVREGRAGRSIQVRSVDVRGLDVEEQSVGGTVAAVLVGAVLVAGLSVGAYFATAPRF